MGPVDAVAEVTVAVAELGVGTADVCEDDSLVDVRTGEVPTFAVVGRMLAASGLALADVGGLVLECDLAFEDEVVLVLSDGRTFPVLSVLIRGRCLSTGGRSAEVRVCADSGRLEGVRLRLKLTA